MIYYIIYKNETEKKITESQFSLISQAIMLNIKTFTTSSLGKVIISDIVKIISIDEKGKKIEVKC